MKIEIDRFGPINKFSYDLGKDFIVTFGNNNIGKSYSMQIVYLLLKTFISNAFGQRLYRNNYIIYAMPFGAAVEVSEEEIKKIVDEFIASSSTSKDITDVIIKGFYKVFSDVFLPEFLNSCKNTFGNFESSLESNPIIHIKYHQFSFDISLKNKRISGDVEAKIIKLRKTESDFHKSRNFKDHLDIYVVSDDEQPTKLIIQQIIEKLTIWSQLIRGDYSDVYFLPASRSGIYSGMNAFGSIVAELSKNRAYITRKIEFPGISEPISDYFIALSSIKSRINEQYVEYYTKIENNILKGKVTFDKNKNALMYKPNNLEAQFEMTEVSSMVSEVSPIVAFLKYILASQIKRGKQGKGILFIEEPEAHLHPNNQIALVEVFSELIKTNVKLVMSSHSNYVFNKLNNLVLSKELNFKCYQPIVLEDIDGGSISKILPIDELGASDENFVDVSERLYYEREDIIQKLNMEE